MGLKFQATPTFTGDGFKQVPLLDVVFTNPENGEKISIQCRIDSGADKIILPAEAGIILGIELVTGEPLEFQGLCRKVDSNSLLSTISGIFLA